MMNPLEMGLIIAGAAVLVLAIMFFAVPWLIKKHIPVTTYLTLSEEGINLVKNILEPLLPPADQKALDVIVKYADLAVKYAEQLYISGQLPADQRRQAALNFILKAAADAGIQLTQAEIDFANAALEAMVYLLPATHADHNSPIASGTVNVNFNTASKALYGEFSV